MMNKSQIKDFFTTEQQHIKKNFQIKSLYLFGSYAKETATKDSDLDLLIEFETNIDSIRETKRKLRAYIEGKLRKKVDLIRPKYLKKYAEPEIIASAIRLI